MTVAVNTAAISNLIGYFNDLVKQGKISEFSEADVGSKFILPLFDALGWDSRNIDEVREQRRTLTGPADYALSVHGVPKLVIEIKKFQEDLDGKRVVRGRDETYPYQATRYAWHLKVDWCILTNFRELRLYYAHTARPRDGLIFKLRYDRYSDVDFDKLSLLSRESVVSGKLDTLEKRRTRNYVDREILKDLVECRKKLVHSIFHNNQELSLNEVKESVQKILDRTLVIRVSEDRGIIGADSLWRELDSWRNRGLPTPFMRSLKSLFRDFDEVYNSKLFEPHICEDLKIDNAVLEFILSDEALYGYNFDLIDADVLGEIYEDYIGHILAEGDDGIEIVESKTARRSRGIYYTPTYIVDYIIRNTLGPVLKNCKTPEDVSKIKVIDPACGSGSFLIKAFDVFKEWYDDYNRREEKNTTQANWHRISQISDIENRILTENLYGVDLDPQAAEIASVNLMLKTLKKGKKLPQILGTNIKIGNSLVSPEDLNALSFQVTKDLSPFNWKEEFIFLSDETTKIVFVGNPPYIGIEAIPDEDKPIYREIYPTFQYRSDVFALFLERSINLLKTGDLCGFIIPSRIQNNNSYIKLRKLMLDDTKIEQIVQLGTDVFKDVKNETMILIIEKIERDKEDKQFIKIITNVENLSNKLYEYYTIPQKLFHETYKNMFNIRLKEEVINIFKKMEEKSIRLSEIAKANQGMRTGDNKKLIMKEKLSDQYKPIVRGKDVKRYFIDFPNLYVNYDPEILDAPRDEKIFTSTKKLIVQEIRNINLVRRVIASYDDSKYYALQTTNVINLLTRSPYSIKYILAILNSKLINFYFRMQWIDIHIKSEYLENIPIYRIDFSSNEKRKHDAFVDLVDKILQQKKLANKIVDDFERYWPPIVDEVSLRYFYDRLNVSDKEIFVLRARGNIRKVYVEEDSDWLILSADYHTTKNGRRQHHIGVPILKCRFEDEFLRKFLLHTIINNRKRIGTGNLSSKILTISVPRFNKKQDKNREVMKTIMEDYLDEIHKKGQLEQEINKIDQEIDREVYQLYDLSKEDIFLIENT